MDNNALTMSQCLGTVVMLITGIIITSIGACLPKLSLNQSEYVAFRFADRDMLMRFHWGLGVGHTYAYSTTGPMKEALPGPALGFGDEAILNARQFEPEVIIPDGRIDGDEDEDEDDVNSSLGSSPSDLNDSDSDNFDTEIAAMYNWDSQVEDSEDF